MGDKLIATREGATLTYIHQDSLDSTSVLSSSTGALVSSIKYIPFGATRSGSVSTDKKFTGQRLDGTGLYYYNARYYDPTIGRFVSPDSVGQKLSSPQTLNRYSYVQNNPLKYTDPTGHFALKSFLKTALKVAAVVAVVAVVVAAAIIAAPVVLGAISTAATMVAASTSVAAVSTAATAVSTTFFAASMAAAPVAAAVAAIPVLGPVATAVASVGLAITGLGGSQAISDAQQQLNPPGALGNWNTTTFEEGDTIQRVGDTAGHYAAPVGQSADASALLPGGEGKPLNIYQFNTSWNALQSTVARQPDWNRGGLGQQYYFGPSFYDLLQGDIISDVTP